MPDNAGIYEGSTLSTIAIAMVPLIWWVARFTTIFPRGKLVTLFAAALTLHGELSQIEATPASALLTTRVRVSDPTKLAIAARHAARRS